MSPFHYLGTTKSGAILKRISTRPDFGVAAVYGKHEAGTIVPLSNTTWSTDRGQLARNSTFRDVANRAGLRRIDSEIVEVKRVDAAAYRAALKVVKS